MRGKELISSLSDDQILSKFWEADYYRWLGKKIHQLGDFCLLFYILDKNFPLTKGWKLKFISLVLSTLVGKVFLLSTPTKNISW